MVISLEVVMRSWH